MRKILFPKPIEAILSINTQHSLICYAPYRIQGNAGFNILGKSTDSWKPIFAVNVYGAVNILQAFTQSIIDAGPLASGKKTHIVTTSSVVGLLNHNPGAYSVSKMAVTAVCEQYAIELENMGSKAPS